MKSIFPKSLSQSSLLQRLRITALLIILAAGYTALQAQNGNLSFSGPLTAPDPTTGMQRCTVSWTNHANFVDRLNITLSFNGTIPICIDVTATKNSIPTVLQPFATVTSGSISIVNFSTVLNVTNLTTPVIIHFRGEPGSNMTLGASLAKVRVQGSTVLGDIAVQTKLVTFAPGFTLAGVAQKLGGTPCTSGINNGITGVTFTLNLAGSPSCVPGGTNFPTSNTPASDSYLFTNLPRNYNYSITPSKSSGCECGPFGPINETDINMGRSYVLGSVQPTILQGHSTDYNADGSASTLDLLLMSQCNLGIPSVPSVWRFTTPFINSTTFSIAPLPAIPAGVINVNNLSGNQSGTFIGFKRGDVDQNCSACGNNLVGSAEDRARFSDATKGLFVPEVGLQAGQEMTVPILAGDALKGLAVLSMEWSLSNRIQLLEVKQALDDEYGLYTERPAGRNSVFHYNWFTMNNGGIDVPSGEALIYLRVRALDNIASLQEVINLLPVANNNRVFYENGKSEAQWRIAAPGTSDESAQMLLRPLGTNSASDTPAQLEIYVPQTSSVQLVITDMSGRIVGTRSIEIVEKGWSVYQLDMPSATGVYQVTARSVFGSKTARIIRY